MSAAKAALKRPLAAAFDGALGGHGLRIVALHLRAFEVKEEGGARRGCVCSVWLQRTAAAAAPPQRLKHATNPWRLSVYKAKCTVHSENTRQNVALDPENPRVP